jgi:hypothetical protein
LKKFGGQSVKSTIRHHDDQVARHRGCGQLTGNRIGVSNKTRRLPSLNQLPHKPVGIESLIVGDNLGLLHTCNHHNNRSVKHLDQSFL